MSDDNKRLIGIKEIAAYMKRSERSVWGMANNGDIPVAKIGGRWETDASSMQAFYDEARKKSQRLATP